MKRTIVVSMVWLIACEYTPPCSPEDEGDDTVGPTELPTPGPGGPTDPGVDPGESDADEYGYSRKLNGQVCACDLTEYQEGGCSKEKPIDCDPHIGWDITTGECAGYFEDKDPPSDPEPPSDPDPNSKRWHCYGTAECYNEDDVGGNEDHYVYLSVNGWGNTKDEAKADAVIRLDKACRALSGLGDLREIKISNCGKL